MILVPCGIKCLLSSLQEGWKQKKNQQRNLSVLEILHKNLPISRTYPGTICSILYPADTYFVQDFGGFVNIFLNGELGVIMGLHTNSLCTK